MAEQTPPPTIVSISIPGVQDIIRMPYFENAQQKRERLTRWSLQAATTPIPESLRWLPQLINWLDSAQDHIYVALVLGLPLLRRLPARFLPFLGWALLGNDMLNLFTAGLSAPLTPRSQKVNFLKTVKRSVAGRAAHIRVAEAFLLPGRAKIIPFTIQAGQVLQDWTGWGLALGGVMGLVSDTWWAAVRAAQGARVIINPPPANDYASRAASFLAQSYNWTLAEQVMNAEELKWLTNAAAIAAGILGAPVIPTDIGDRLEQLSDINLPLYRIENNATRVALAEERFADLFDQRPASYTTYDNPTFAGAMQVTIATTWDLDIKLAQHFRPTTYDWPYGLQMDELSQWTWDVFGGGHNFVVPTTSPMERMLGVALEMGVLPPFLAHPFDNHMLTELRKYGVEITDAADCDTLGTPYRQPRFFKYPPAYPPPSIDPQVQLAHWCAIGLALWCGRNILIPFYSLNTGGDVTRDTCDFKIDGWLPNTRKWGLQSMGMAALLVWGTQLSRFQQTEDEQTAPTPGKPGICRDSGERLPSLTGASPERDPFLSVLQAFQGDTVIFTRTGATGRPFDPMLGRDWLDAYMREQDPRRAGRPAFPTIPFLPVPDEPS